MIGSFWNLCRACPSMPVDKLHSEYRSTYRWHEYTGPRQEIIRRPPQSNAAVSSGDKLEVYNTARVQEEETHDELPKLEPALPRRKKHPDLAYRHHEFLIGDDGSNFEGFNTDRARSEDRGSQHWKLSRRSKSEGPARERMFPNDENSLDLDRRHDSDPDLENTGRDGSLLRKAISKISTEYRLQFAWPQGHKSRRDAADSAPKKSQSMGALKPTANAMVHKKRIEVENKDASELEPLVNEDKARREDSNTEYKKNFRPFSQYDYSEGRFTKRGALNQDKDTNEKKIENEYPKESWYREVVELRKKAGEYKHRGWGSNLAPEKVTDIYNKQVELWDQVSRRSSLSALSLASTTHRSYTKEEKEEENQKKSSPTKPYRNGEQSKVMKELIRHHLERTTGGSELDGLILSPTREKLEPTIPRKDDNSRGSQKNSPKKNSPQKSTLIKKNPQKNKTNLRTVRSHSVGPPDKNLEKRSPKRQLRSATVKEKKTTPRRPRPSSLNTSSVTSRTKSSTVPYKKEDERLAKSNKNAKDTRVQKNELRKGGPADNEQGEEIETSNKPAEQRQEYVDLEPVVKSPPEPTRVKSPEQILMRSPDPVNWTVPLDTGKTFTVTQNVREGDYSGRPHSEIKAWTPPEVPPPVAQSAPPQLPPQAKEQAADMEISASKLEPLMEESLRTEDPYFSKSTCPYLDTEQVASTSATVGRSLVAEMLESALSRFDRFWGNQKDEATKRHTGSS